MTETPETIYLIPGEDVDGAPAMVWCDDPAPGEGMDPAEAVKYIRADKHQDRIEELETVVKVFRGCVETRMFPAKDSPCYDMMIRLVGERDDEETRLVQLQQAKSKGAAAPGLQSENRAGPVMQTRKERAQ